LPEESIDMSLDAPSHRHLFRRELAEEFRQHLFGPHSPALRVMLNRMRSHQGEEVFVLVCLEPFRKWALARKSPKRGAPATLVPGVTFTNAAEAEWEVFKRHWQQQTGEVLS
jgi:hypothetical protein